jgi:hypothetical protein
MNPGISESVLVVVEDGAEWPCWLKSLEAGAGPMVYHQDEGEALPHFADRVSRQLEALIGRDQNVEMAVIASNERCDDHALDARRSIASAILSFMARHGTGRLLFTEGFRQGGRSRAALSALAADLAGEWEGAGVTVSVRFGDPSRPPQMSEGDISVPRVA